jgi:hypothetical protein
VADQYRGVYSPAVFVAARIVLSLIVALSIVLCARGIRQPHRHGQLSAPHLDIRWQVCKLGVRRNPLPSLSVARTNLARAVEDVSEGAGRLRVMVTEATIKFGKRMNTLLDLSGLTSGDIARYMRVTVEHIEKNYLGGRQFPTGNGMYKLYVLLGIPMGQIYGTEPLDASLIDKIAIRSRLEEFT